MQATGIKKKDQHKTIGIMICLFLLIMLSIHGFHLRQAKIAASLPYTGQLDEGYLLEPAKNIILNNDFNPHVFTYPSLTIYLASLGIVGGYFKEATHLPNEAHDVSVIGRVTYPFYDQPKIIKGAKEFFALLSVLTFFCIGLAAYKAYRKPVFLVLPALFLSMSAFYLSESWTYINVDIVAATLVAFFYACLFANMDKDTYLKRAIIPGLAAGLVIASKYNMFPAVFITPLAVLLFNCHEKYIKAAVAVAASVVAFFLASPYVLLDINHFISHAAGQINHYQTGHPGHTETPGITHALKYLSVLIQDYGWASLVLALFGVFYAFKIRWKHTLILLAFPLGLLLYMSLQKTYFQRNILPLYALWSIFSALGVLCLHDLNKQGLIRLLPRFFKPATGLIRDKFILNGLSVGILIIAVVFLMPVSRLFDTSLPTDSRNEAAQWINQNIPAGATIIMGTSIDFDTRTLSKDYQIKPVDFRKNGLDIAVVSPKDTYVIVPMFKSETNKKNIRLSAIINKTIKKVLSRRAQHIEEFGSRPVSLVGKNHTHWYSGYVYVPATKYAKFSIYKL